MSKNVELLKKNIEYLLCFHEALTFSIANSFQLTDEEKIKVEMAICQVQQAGLQLALVTCEVKNREEQDGN